MPYKIFVFVPGFGQQVSAATFLATHQLQAALAAKGINGGITTLSFPDISELRSMATTVFYDAMPDHTHILMIDSDMGFSPELVFDMLAFGEPVVGSIYPQRRLPTSWAGSGTGQSHAERRGNFIRVEGVGTGCILIHREAIRHMMEKMPEIVDNRLELHPARDLMYQAGTRRLIRCFEKLDIPDRGIVSEDLSFCIRWNRCGGQVWANIGHRISHVGPFDFAARYLDAVEAGQVNVDFASQVRNVDPVFTSMAPSAPVPMPGAVNDMPGGPADKDPTGANAIMQAAEAAAQAALDPGIIPLDGYDPSALEPQTVEVVGTIEIEPPAKKRRGRPPKPTNSGNSTNHVSA